MSANRRGQERAAAPDVIGAADAARICCFSKSRLSQIINDPLTTFPSPAKIQAAGRAKVYAFDRAAVVAWQQARTLPKRRAMYVVLMEHGKGRTVSQAAASAGVHSTTARAWLKELGRL
jgi:hypothetical protein